MLACSCRLLPPPLLDLVLLPCVFTGFADDLFGSAGPIFFPLIPLCPLFLVKEHPGFEAQVLFGLFVSDVPS